MTKSIPMLSLAVSLAAFGVGPAFAQSTSGSNAAQTGGVTSGPASPSGQQTTLGTGGVTGATPGQRHVLRGHGGKAITAERRGQRGGTHRSVRAGKPGAESGAPPSQKPTQP